MGFELDLESNAGRVPVMEFPNGIEGGMQMREKKIYPNDPCPCGSGKKYKKCCGRNVNMCEMKFYGDEFVVDKNYDRLIRNRISLLEKELSPKMAIHSTLITTFGLKYNEYSGDFVNVINMDALFE